MSNLMNLTDLDVLEIKRAIKAGRIIILGTGSQLSPIANDPLMLGYIQGTGKSYHRSVMMPYFPAYLDTCEDTNPWHRHNPFHIAQKARYAFPTPLPTTRSSYRPDRPVVRSLRSVNRNR